MSIFQILLWWIGLSNRDRRRTRCDVFHYARLAMKKIILFAFSLAVSSATAFSGERHIAFERNNAVYLANLDGTNEKKIADGIFSAISPDGTRVAFNTVEKTSETTLCASHGGRRHRDRKGERLQGRPK